MLRSTTKETPVSTVNSFGAQSTLSVGGTDYEIYRIDAVEGYEKLPFSLKVLLENQLRTEDGANVTSEQITALGQAIYLSPLKWVVIFAPLAMVFFLSFRINRMSVAAATTTFWVYAALMGLSLSSTFFIYTCQRIRIGTNFIRLFLYFLSLLLTFNSPIKFFLYN